MIFCKKGKSKIFLWIKVQNNKAISYSKKYALKIIQKIVKKLMQKTPSSQEFQLKNSMISKLDICSIRGFTKVPLLLASTFYCNVE